MKAPQPYVLGSEAAELARLEHQHEVWRPMSAAVFDRLGVARGWKVLDAGCGPGLVLAELCARVGAEGEAWGADLSAAMLAEAARRCKAAGGAQAQLHEGDLVEIDLPLAHFDLIWCRWVLSFPPDPGAIVARLARSLKPGGLLAVQDYHHHGIGMHPPSRGFAAAIRAVRALYGAAGGDPWVGGALPRLFRTAGLELEEFRAEILTGGPGEPAFEWGDRFFPAWVPKFEAQGLMTRAEAEEFQAEWQARREDPDARFFSPVVVTAVGRRPDRTEESAQQ